MACSNKPGNASFQITNEGSGQANAESLFPLREGSLYRGGPSAPALMAGQSGTIPIQDGFLVDGSAQFNGAKAVRYTDRRTGAVTFLTETTDGWLELGTTEDGPYPHATLLVPAVVKVGMTWESTPDDLHHFKYEVLARTEQDTPFGHKPVWRVSQTGVEAQTLIVRSYIEGRGLWMLDFQDGLGGAPIINAVGAVVLSGQIPDPPPAHPLALAELPVPDAALGTLFQHLGENFGVNLVQGLSGPPLLMGEGIHSGALQDDYTKVCATVSGSGVAPGKFAPGEFGVIADTTTCPTRNVPTGNGANTVDLLNGHADGALPTAGGMFWLPRELAGETQQYLPNAGDSELPLVLLSAPSGGAAHVGLDSPGYPDHMVVIGDGVETYIADRWAAHARTYPRALALGPSAATRPVLLEGNSGAIWSGTAALTGVSALRLERGFAGLWSVATTAAGTGVFRVLQDGTADRLVLADTGLELQRAGEVQLPAGQRLLGLFEAKLDGMPASLAVTYGPSAAPHGIDEAPFFGLHLFQVTTALGATPLQRSPAFGVQATALAGLYRDVEVCWPPGLGPAVLTGWTLGGHPATAAVANPDGTCVIVMRDRSLPAPPRDVNGIEAVPPGYEALEGTIPGVGAMAFAGPFDTLTSLLVPDGQGWAPLLQGGYEVKGSLIDEGGQAFDGPTPYLDRPGQDRLDAAGNGLWLTTVTVPNGTTQDALWLRGAQTHEIALPDAGASTPKPQVTLLGSIPGGGVAIERLDGPAPKHLVLPDGTYKPLAPWASSAAGYCGALADGTACVSSATFTCGGAAGPPVTVAVPAGTTLDCPWLALSDGTFLAPSISLTNGAKATVRVDPRTGAVSAYDTRQYQATTWAADGTVWTMAFSDPSALDAVPVKATPAGFVPLALPSWKQLLVPSDLPKSPFLTRVAVGEHIITVFADVKYDHQLLLFRLPRP